MKMFIQSMKNWGRRGIAFTLSLVMALSMAFGAFALADEEQPNEVTAAVQEAVGAGFDGLGMVLGMVVEAMKEMAGQVENIDLSQLEELDLQAALPEIKLPALSGAVRVELPDAGAELVAALLSMDVSWLKSVELDLAGKDTTVNAALSLNEKQLVSALLTYVAESRTLFAQLPELSKSFIKMELGKYIDQAMEQMTSQSAGSMEQIKEMLPMIQKAISMLPEYLPDGTVVQSIVSRYGHIIASHIKDIKSEEGEVNAELIEMKEKAMVYTVTITEEELANCVFEVLVTLQDDEEVKGVLAGLVGYINALNEEFPEMGLGEADADEIWDSFVMQLEDGKEIVQGSTTVGGNAKAGNFFQLKLYVDGNGMPIGFAFVLSNDGEDPMELFHLYLPALLGKNGIELVVSPSGMEAFSFAGNGGITATGYNGSYKINVYGMTMVELEVVDAGQTEKGLEGSLIVKPGYGLGMLLDESAAMLLSYSLKFNWQILSDVAMLHISLLDADKAELVKLSFGVAPGAEVTEAIPGEDATVYDIENFEDGEAYGSEIDVQGLLAKVIEAGVPAELINSLLGQ